MARQLRSVTIVMLLAIVFVGVVAYVMTQRQHEHSRMPTQHFGIADPSMLGETTTMQASQLAAMKAIGITSVRVDADWGMV